MANQLSVSVTQKSVSLCVMIAYGGVITTSSWIENSLFCCFKKFITVSLFLADVSGVFVSVSGAGDSDAVSKFRSLNTGKAARWNWC